MAANESGGIFGSRDFVHRPLLEFDVIYVFRAVKTEKPAE
jgi:hypothetical protein